MYGKVIYIGGDKFSILGDDNKKYLPTPESIDLLARTDTESYVSFKPATSNDGARAAYVSHVIVPGAVNKERIAHCVQSWDQEANRDSGVFIHTDAYRAIASDRKCFIVGRKGVGKSAVVKALIEEGHIGKVFSPEDFPFEQIYKLGASTFTKSRYKPIWVILYISLAISILATNDAVPEAIRKKILQGGKDKGPGALPGILNGIRDLVNHPYIETVGDAAAFGLLSLNLPPLNPFKAISAPLNFLSDQFSDSSTPNDADKTLREIQDELIEYYISLGEKPVVLVAFDQLDDEYKKKNYAEYPDLIESLFSASSWILDNSSGTEGCCGLAIKPVVILRDDIFETQFDTNNKAKYLSYVVKPEWDKSNLQQVLHARLSQAINSDCKERPFEDLWLDVFSPFFPNNPNAFNEDLRFTKPLKYYSSYECFIRHTSRTPRDVIELLKEVLTALVKNNNDGKYRCDYDVFMQARSLFSTYYYAQVVDGMQTAFPSIKTIFEVIKDRCQASTISRDKLTEYIKDTIIPDENKEDAQINGLFQSMSSSNDHDLIKLITNRIHELRSKINGRTDTQIRGLLKLLWDVCAIGLLSNSGFRAKYLNSEDFSIKIGEQIAFHPSLAVHLNMDIAIIGLPYQEQGDFGNADFENENVASYPRELLIDSQQRARISNELTGKYWNLTFSQNPIPFKPAFLTNDEFPNNVFCPVNKIPKGAMKGCSILAEICITSDGNKDEDDPLKWNYCVKSIEADSEEESRQPRYSISALSNPLERIAIQNTLERAEWKMKFYSKIGSGIFLSHPEFPNNVFCSIKTLKNCGVYLNSGQEITVNVTINNNNGKWGYIATHLKSNS